MKTSLLEKLEAIPAAGNNGFVRLDCLRPAQLRRLMQFKAELEARGNIIFTEISVYTAHSYAVLLKHTENIQHRMAVRAAAAREQIRAKELAQQKADYALDALLARGERMTMTS